MLRIDPLRLSLTVPQQEMARIKAGQTVTFQTDAFPGKTFTGTVRYITPAGDRDNRSLCVEAVVPNPGAVLRPGLFVTAELHLDEQQTELFVPAGGRSQPRRRGRRVRGPRRRRPRADRLAGRGGRAGGSTSPPAWRPASRRSPRPTVGPRRQTSRPMNFLASICIRRPVFAMVLTLVLLVFGVVGYLNLGLDRFPKIDFPIITVTTRLPGSASEEVETEITDKIEEAVNTTSGIDELRSVSSEGISQVFITFVLEKDADVAAQEVRDKVNRILPDLPKGIEQPLVEKFDPDSIARDDDRRFGAGLASAI